MTSHRFFKSIQLKVPLTSLTFTADGTSLAVGTENGKIIVQDLRAMEHDHRTLTVCDEGKGEHIIGLSIQVSHLSKSYLVHQ